MRWGVYPHRLPLHQTNKPESCAVLTGIVSTESVSRGEVRLHPPSISYKKMRE